MKAMDDTIISSREAWRRANPNRVITAEDERRWAEEDRTLAQTRRAEITTGKHLPTVLYAEIKKSSKYYGQGAKGEKFPVTIQSARYCVQGGPGGQYRIEDVHLFALLNDNSFQQIA